MISISLTENIRIYFSTVSEKVQYVKEEAKFTAKEYSVYSSALSKKDRADRKKELYNKRAKFAKYKGYGPSSKNKRVWIKLDRKITPVA